MPSNITPQRVPLVDPQTGIISREWYNFFLTLFNLTGAGGNDISLTDLQVAPPPFEMGEILKAIAAGGVPSGAIIIHTGPSCPAGYTEYTALRSTFPRGAAGGVPGGTGGTTTHTHTITLTDLGPAGGLRSINNGTGVAVTLADNTHTHGNTGSAGNAGTLPPYLDVLYCQKT